MAVELEGDCRVVSANETEGFAGPPSLEVLDVDVSREFYDEAVEQLLYIVEGAERDTSIYVPPGARATVSGPCKVVVATCPVSFRGAETARNPHPSGEGIPRFARNDTTIVHLSDVARQTTADRWYCELIQGETTQFVGSIPPGRAPDHFHLYEEVLYILSGEGIMHAGSKSAPVGPGSRIYLPRRQRHCVENTGTGELRLLGVFYPAGSPAVRYPA